MASDIEYQLSGPLASVVVQKPDRFLDATTSSVRHPTLTSFHLPNCCNRFLVFPEGFEQITAG